MKTLPLTLATVLVLVAGWMSPAADDRPGWKPDAAGKYLDDKATAWLKYRMAGRGEAASRTTCVTCHTTFAYAVGRPALRAVTKEAPTPQEQQILGDVRRRTMHWDQ